MRAAQKYYAILGKAAPFSPLDLSPALWLDASDTSTITASGGSVSQWDDKSGNGRNVTQGTAANQPQTGSTLNGLNVLSFDGDYLVSNAAASTWKFLHDGTVTLIAAVWRAGTVADPDAGYGFLGTSIATAGVGFAIMFEDRTVVPLNNGLRQNAYLGTGNSADASIDSLNGNIMTPNVAHVTSFLTSPSAATGNRTAIRVDAGSVVKNNTGNDAPSSADPANTLMIGGTGSTAGPIALVGNIAELVIVGGANATEANRTALHDYLAAKWGL